MILLEEKNPPTVRTLIDMIKYTYYERGLENTEYIVNRNIILP